MIPQSSDGIIKNSAVLDVIKIDPIIAVISSSAFNNFAVLDGYPIIISSIDSKPLSSVRRVINGVSGTIKSDIMSSNAKASTERSNILS